MQHLGRANISLEACQRERECSATGCSSLSSRRIAPCRCDLDFAGVAKGSTWHFRSTQLENRVKRKRRTVLTRRRRVGETAGRPRRRQTDAVVPADRRLIFEKGNSELELVERS